MHATVTSYLTGFFASLILTLTSFLLVMTRALSARNLLYTIVGLAILQAFVQLRFFLHLGQEAKPRWESVVFYFMIMVLLIVVVGSLWIMFDLNARLMQDVMHDVKHD